MIKITSIILGLLISQWAFSYGDLGHKTIAAVAWPQLTPFARQNVERILGAGLPKFVNASVWADQIKKDDRFNDLKPLHYVNLPATSHTYQKNRDCPKNKCAVEAINMFSDMVKSGNKKQQTLALRMLVHLIADVHQPLHAGFKKDRGGNWTEVKYKKKTISLHKLWDKQILERIADDWQSMALHISLKGIRVPVLTPKAWAEDSHKIAMEFVYTAKENRKVKKEYLLKAQAITELQLGKAGWRLAMWLNKLW
jgi:hypothetical protein